MKSFSKSTILGLAFGILLAGYAVFAYTPPTLAPPDGNVVAPLNVGGDDQVKIGGLWVGNLFTDGLMKMGEVSSLPTCDSTVKGGLLFDTTADKPYVCAGVGWKPLDSDNDEDGLVDWFDPNDNVFNPTCTTDNNGECFITQSSKSALDGDLASGNIRSGINVFGISGTYSGVPLPPNCVADNGGNCQIVQASKSALDTDLSAGNIKSGVNIFGVTGSLTPAASTDIVAEGVIQKGYGLFPCCGSAGHWRNGASAGFTEEYDPRGVLGVTNNIVTCSGPTGCTQTYPGSYTATCSGGFNVGSTVVTSFAAFSRCTFGPLPNGGCQGVACFHP